MRDKAIANKGKYGGISADDYRSENVRAQVTHAEARPLGRRLAAVLGVSPRIQGRLLGPGKRRRIRRPRRARARARARARFRRDATLLRELRRRR